jgi:hypothetical protein
MSRSAERGARLAAGFTTADRPVPTLRRSEQHGQPNTSPVDLPQRCQRLANRDPATWTSMRATRDQLTRIDPGRRPSAPLTRQMSGVRVPPRPRQRRSSAHRPSAWPTLLRPAAFGGGKRCVRARAYAVPGQGYVGISSSTQGHPGRCRTHDLRMVAAASANETLAGSTGLALLERRSQYSANQRVEFLLAGPDVADRGEQPQRPTARARGGGLVLSGLGCGLPVFGFDVDGPAG